MRRRPASLVPVLALGLALGAARHAAVGGDLRCEAPPYGDVSWNYMKLKDRFPNVEEEKLDDLLESLCEAKLHSVGRRHFYHLGITRHDFATRSTTELAAKVLAHAGTVAH